MATTWVQEGETLLRDTSNLTASADPATHLGIAIQPEYLAWAEAAAPQLGGWSSDRTRGPAAGAHLGYGAVQPGTGLNPPADTPVYVWIAPGELRWAAPMDNCSS